MIFYNSENYKNVMGANLRMLIIRRRYVEMSVAYWTEQGSADEIKFFTEELKLIDERMNTLKGGK